MAFRTEGLLPASWKGVPFSIRSELQTEGGRRIILHDYPNSNERYIEDMGVIPPNFKLTAFVHGYDFLNRADKLERALNEEGAGDLYMPTFGKREVYALPYQKDATQRAVGIIRFELSFVAGRATSGPVRAKPTPETVFAKGDTARFQIGEVLEKKWIQPTETTDVQAAIYDLEQMVRSTNYVLSVVNNSSDLQSTINLILQNAPKIVRSGESMKTSFMSNLWQTVSEGLLEGAGFKALIDLTKFGGNLTLSLSDVYSAYDTARDDGFDYGIPTWPATTASRRARNTNRLNLVNSGRTAALVTAYEQAADSNYNTETQVDNARASLDVEYNRLMKVDAMDSDIIQSDPVVRTAIDEVRSSASDVLDQKEQSVYKLATLNTAPVSSFVESHQLYAEEFTTENELIQRAIVLRDLNPTQSADRLSGDITVLQK